MDKIPNYVVDTDDELCHWGILGQKWGHRRFQNEDGSLTAEGRERYGVSEARSKSDAQKAKARISYNTQKYKADLKSKAKREADTRTAKEERHRVKEYAKTERLAKKEQAKTDSKGTNGIKFRKTKNMSDEELSKAIDRLKLQAEYNKAYTIATSPNSALAKADRFFEGPTGKLVGEIAKQTIPNIANTALNKVLENNLKYSNRLDREKMEADIAKTKADTAKALADAKKDKSLSDIERREKEANIANTLASANQRNAMAWQQQATARASDSKLLGDEYEYDIEKGMIVARKKKK